MTEQFDPNHAGPGRTTLESANAVVLIDHFGARLRSIRVGGNELLVADTGEIDSTLMWGCYPMVPWVGRVDRGIFEFDGRSHQMPINLPPHSIHGTGLTNEWTEEAPGTLRLDLSDPWPFGGVARTHAELHSDSLTITISVTAGHQAMPAVVGWHPVFRKHIGSASAALTFEPRRMWLRDSDGIPTGDHVSVPPGPWDDCFVGVSSNPSISWGDDLAVTLESATDTWVVYDETPYAICVEPQTGPANAFNHPDCLVLQPGETLALPFTIRWG